MNGPDDFFVNLPLGHVFASDLPALFLDRGIRPEIGLDGLDLGSPEILEDLGKLAGQFAERGLPCTVHLPFSVFAPRQGLLMERPGQYREALDAARMFSPIRLVAHPYLQMRGGVSAWARDMDRAADMWRGLLETWPGHPPLCLENVFDVSPGPLAELVDRIDSPDVGICFDVGHWNCFSGAAAQGGPELWVRELGRRILHLHLHDNDGSADQHLGPGRGSIPWDRLFAGLKQAGIAPTMTLEAHTVEDFEAGLAYLSRFDLPPTA